MQNQHNEPDELLVHIAEYVHQSQTFSDVAIKTAHRVLLDSLGCLLMALQVPACRKLLGPIVPGTIVPLGARVPGTYFELDPLKAAFDIGTAIRWLDYNDTWLAAEWGHPSDNLGGILAVSDFLGRRVTDKRLRLNDLFHWMIKAHEIQGILAENHAFNQVGLDHVLLVKVATAAVASVLLGLSKDQTVAAVSNAWIDGQSLRTYRHAPNTGSRKSWAAGDATSRGLHLAWLVMQGEQGYPTALSAKRWGFCDSVFRGKPLQLARPFTSYVMENVLFKVAFPAEFHAQTAVECAIQLYPIVKDRWDDIESIKVFTQESAMHIIHKEGPLHNYADRDHCLQYMIAIGLLFGELTADYYSDKVASDPRIDRLRSKMQVEENIQFSRDYLDPNKRAIANAIQIFFRDKTESPRIQIDYPLGHPRRRAEAVPYLYQKYQKAVIEQYSEPQALQLLKFWDPTEDLFEMPFQLFMDQWGI